MKLKYKILLSTGLIWALFLLFVTTFFLPVLNTTILFGFIATGTLFYLLICLIVHFLVTKRIELMSHDCALHKSIATKKFGGKDEIFTLANQINKLTNTLRHTEKKLTSITSQREKINFSENNLDISNDHLVQLAHYDNLTTLPNLVFFNEMLNKTLNHASRHHKVLALLLIDIDHFKHINDELGTTAGDEILKEIAQRFSTTLRSSDIIARLGGDEFIILINDIDQAKFSSPVAEKLLQICAKPIRVNDRDFFLNSSIGISIFPMDGTTLENLQKKADIALHKAKSAGGGIYQYFLPEMTLEANKHIQIDMALRKAISNNEFLLYYQPKVKLLTGTITGVEALIRWANPTVGIIDPAYFIPQAEEIGLMLAIGDWVLREACRANKAWQDQGFEPITVAVNLSPKQFAHPGIVKQVEDALLDSGMDPKYLELEITEMTIMDDVVSALQKLNHFKQMGIKVCIDDFGTGYTSISSLKKFPIDVLKIDQNLIKGVPGNQNDTGITAAIIALGHNLGMEIVAEGVENTEQLQYLTNYNCDLVQGYYFSRPLPEQKIVLQFKTHR